MLIINVPSSYDHERKYILDVIFECFLGLKYQVKASLSVKNWQIRLHNKRVLEFEDHFFSHKSDGHYLDFNNIPRKVAYINNQFTVSPDLPVIYGTGKFEEGKSGIVCGADILLQLFLCLPGGRSMQILPGISMIAFRR